MKYPIVFCLLFLAVTAFSLPIGRLYFKYNGAVAAAFDASGNSFIRSNKETPGSYAHGGLRFKKNGVTLFSIREGGNLSDEQLGKFVASAAIDQNQSLPLQNTGSLEFKYQGIGRAEFDHTDGSVNIAALSIQKFGYRKNAALLSPVEKIILRDAILSSKNQSYPGDPMVRTNQQPFGGVNYWYKQDEIHQATHVHSGPSFIPWHRYLVDQFEDLLRMQDPLASMHYWDWTTDPSTGILTGSNFMGAANGEMGEPWLSAGFYKPDCNPNATAQDINPINPCRGEYSGSAGGAVNGTGNGFDPPQSVSRGVNFSSLYTDQEVVHSADAFTMAEQWQVFSEMAESAHNSAHGAINGTIGVSHSAFEDPFVFLLHSNLDRLFASWQRLGGPGDATGCSGSSNWRLDVNCNIYGNYQTSPGEPRKAIAYPMEPWSHLDPTAVPVLPWANPGAGIPGLTSTTSYVITPRLYDGYAQ